MGKRVDGCERYGSIADAFPLLAGNDTCGFGNFTHPCQLHEVWDSLMLEKRLLDFGPYPTNPHYDPREQKRTAHFLFVVCTHLTRARARRACSDGLSGKPLRDVGQEDHIPDHTAGDRVGLRVGRGELKLAHFGAYSHGSVSLV